MLAQRAANKQLLGEARRARARRELRLVGAHTCTVLPPAPPPPPAWCTVYSQKPACAIAVRLSPQPSSRRCLSCWRRRS